MPETDWHKLEEGEEPILPAPPVRPEPIAEPDTGPPPVNPPTEES